MRRSLRSRGEGEQPPYWKRLEVVMKVQMGMMGIEEAAKELGITRKHYYRLEQEMVSAALKAVTPGKRGPKRREEDPKMGQLRKKLQQVEKEREILRLKLEHLEEVQKEMVSRGVAEGKKKKGGGEGGSRKARKKVQPGVQTTGALGGRGREAEGGNRKGDVSTDEPRSGNTLPMEGDARGEAAARPQRGRS
jgi:hypothetical protein